MDNTINSKLLYRVQINCLRIYCGNLFFFVKEKETSGFEYVTFRAGGKITN